LASDKGRAAGMGALAAARIDGQFYYSSYLLQVESAYASSP